MGAQPCGGIPGNASSSQLAPTDEEPLAPLALEQSAASRMCFAAYAGDAQAIQKLLSTGISVNAADYDRRTALHIAASGGHLEVLQVLLSSRADFQAVDRWGRTALDAATLSGNEDIMAALRVVGAEDGATPPQRRPGSSIGISCQHSLAGEDTPESPFKAAGRLSRPSIEEECCSDLEQGMKLCCAAAAGSVPIVRQLVGQGTSVNAADYNGRTGLHLAAAHGNKALVSELLALRADLGIVDNFGSTPLAEALRHGQEDTAVLLLGARSAREFERQHSAPAGQPCLRDDIQQPSAWSRQHSGGGSWTIQAHEVQLGPELSRTLKSIIHLAEWRGTKVVAKTLQAPTSQPSSWWLSASGQVVADEDETILAKEVLREISLLTTMRHPDLVMFLGACLDHSPPFFILEFMEGGDLDRHYLAQWKKLGHPYRPPLMLYLKWACSVARALCFLHKCSQPIIHRDLKPMNLLLDRNQDLKVTDFGISKIMKPALDSNSLDAPRMSGGVGTWRYMAPEVVRNEQYTDKVDVYSFALILWYMSTGIHPFVEEFGKDAELVLKDYLKGNEPRPRVDVAGVLSSRGADELRKLVQECWHAEPTRRPCAHECTQRLVAVAAASASGGSSWAFRAASLARRRGGVL